MKASGRVWVLAAVGLSGALSTALYSIRSWGELGAPAVAEGPVEPVLETVGSGLGGIVAKVCAKQGDRIRAGDVVLRFDDSAVRARLRELTAAERSAEDAMRGQRAVERIPDRLKRYLYQTHPDVVAAEKAYVAALEAFDAAPVGQRGAARLRLSEATEDRVRARRRLDLVLQHAGAGQELSALTGQLRKNRVEAEAFLRQTEARAASDGVVDVLDLSKGDSVLPRSPVALVRRTDEYACELPIAKAARWRRGMLLRGALAGERPLLASVDSVSPRQSGVGFRENRDHGDEMVVRLRIHSTQAIDPGALARFPVP